MHNPNLILIKDFKDGDFYLYWMDDLLKELVGPDFVTLDDAEEWWLHYQFRRYSAPERRASIIDRRRLHAQRNAMARGNHVASHRPDGRRYTDQTVEVNLDVSRDGMMRFMTQHMHGA